MTNYQLYLAAIISASIIIYYLSNKNSKTAADSTADNLETDYTTNNNNPEELFQNILQDPDWFYIIANRLQGEKILGITQCLKLTAVEDWIRKSMENGTDKSLWQLTGVRFKQEDNPGSYYLVLTDKNLHYLGYREGVCLDHIYFQTNSFINLQLEATSYKETVIREGRVSVATSTKLSFLSRQKNYNIIIYDFIIDSPFQYLVTIPDINLGLKILKNGFQTALNEITISIHQTENIDV